MRGRAKKIEEEIGLKVEGSSPWKPNMVWDWELIS